MTTGNKRMLKVRALYETRFGLYAVGDDGDVYVYQGKDHGWSKLNMRLMNTRELRAKMKSREENEAPEW